jgi:tetratricopeptide (TPR) repeat protein
MMKPFVGHTTLRLDSETDPLPSWRESLDSANPERMVKLLVEIAAWTQSHPKSIDALTLLGDAYLKIKQPYAAEKAFRTALSLKPDSGRAREGLGLALMQTDRQADAIKHLDLAHRLEPTNAEVLVHLGLALVQKNHLKAAHKRFQMALELDPSKVQARLNLGLVDARRGAWQSAIGHFQLAIAQKPDFAEALHNLALAFRHVGELDQALSAAEELTTHHPRQAHHWILLAELRLNGGQIEPSQLALARALELDPGNPNIYLTQAALYAAQRQYADAQGVLTTALVLSRDNPDIQLEMGHLQLLLGRLATGWDLIEARKNVTHSPVRRFTLPEWRGEDISGKSLLVHAEQGLGDTIMFAHCVPDLLGRISDVVIEVSTKLAPLFSRSFPTATIVGRDPQAVDMDWLQRLSPSVGYQIPIGSLPKHFRREPDQFPDHAGYLKADPERVAYWRERLGNDGRPVVGLAWQGGLLHTGRKQRSFSLHEWGAQLRDFPVRWVSLQYGESAAQEAANAVHQGLNLSHWPDTLKDQDDVAALTCALDSVVTVCSTQAHLTGALGRPGWVLTPFNPNWRYGAEGETMLWYPSLRLLRQTAPGDWSGPLNALRQRLVAPDRVQTKSRCC